MNADSARWKIARARARTAESHNARDVIVIPRYPPVLSKRIHAEPAGAQPAATAAVITVNVELLDNSNTGRGISTVVIPGPRY